MFAKVHRISLVLITVCLGLHCYGGEVRGVKEDAKKMWNNTEKDVKTTTRRVQDKSCEMVNGKMECAARKVKHSIQGSADNVEDEVK